MKHRDLVLILLILLLLPAAGHSQSRSIYLNPDFSSLAKNKKTQNIPPFQITLKIQPKDKA